MVLLKNILFIILVPGTVTVLVPYLMASRDSMAAPQRWGAPQHLALLLALLGGSVYLRCVWDFGATGRGTPAPIDPPKVLVVQGLYRYVRNPMYLGVLLVLLGEALFLGSLALLMYAAMLLGFFHLFVILYEEPHLRGRFGPSYVHYCARVRRWTPGRRYSSQLLRPSRHVGPPV